MAWNFELVAGPFKGRTGGLAWDGKGMLVSAVLEERVLRFDPAHRQGGELSPLDRPRERHRHREGRHRCSARRRAAGASSSS